MDIFWSIPITIPYCKNVIKIAMINFFYDIDRFHFFTLFLRKAQAANRQEALQYFLVFSRFTFSISLRQFLHFICAFTVNVNGNITDKL